MPIYTRTGDSGKTGLFNGVRVLKSHIRVETYGTIDELNSVIGVAVAEVQRSKSRVQSWKKKIVAELQAIQNDLLDIGSSLAFPNSPPVMGLAERTVFFEKLIDDMTLQMPELKNFILPGGGVATSQLHIARVAARKAERRIVLLMQKEEIDEQIVKYINRVSDLFFTMARFVNHLEKQKEMIWKKK